MSHRSTGVFMSEGEAAECRECKLKSTGNQLFSEAFPEYCLTYLTLYF